MGQNTRETGPAAGTAAFKEWELVCRALGAGLQTILLRKGGIHEGRGGFAFENQAFVLFPTRFHAQRDALKGTALEQLGVPDGWKPPQGEPDQVEIALTAELVAAGRVTDWSQAEALDDLHVWTPETVRERFEYEGQGDGLERGCLSVALVRVFRLAEPWVFPYRPAFGGCRSWLTLPAAPDGLLDRREPVLDQPGFDQAADALAARTGIGAQHARR
jgi:hypothetical protein